MLEEPIMLIRQLFDAESSTYTVLIDPVQRHDPTGLKSSTSRAVSPAWRASENGARDGCVCYGNALMVLQGTLPANFLAVNGLVARSGVTEIGPPG